MSSRELTDLRDEVRIAALKHKELCKAAGFELLIYCTRRDTDEQIALYAQGRTTPGKIATNARAGESAHNPQEPDGKSVAYDCCPLMNGKPVWSASSNDEVALWQLVGKLGEQAGLVWSGRWAGKLKEMCHFQSCSFSRSN